MTDIIKTASAPKMIVLRRLHNADISQTYIMEDLPAEPPEWVVGIPHPEKPDTWLTIKRFPSKARARAWLKRHG